jgi:hypothetical protein
VSGHFSGIDIQTPPRGASICPEQRAWIMLPVRCARLYARTSKHASIEIHAFGGHGASRTLACRARWERLRPRRRQARLRISENLSVWVMAGTLRAWRAGRGCVTNKCHPGCTAGVCLGFVARYTRQSSEPMSQIITHLREIKLQLFFRISLELQSPLNRAIPARLSGFACR